MKINKGSHQAIFNRKKVAPSNKKKIVQKQLSQWTPLQTNQQNIQHTSDAVVKNPRPPQTIAPSTVVVKRHNKEMPMPASEISRELLRIRGTWPFDMAPDELIIEEKRLIIKRNTFPVGGAVMSLPLKRLVSFEVNHAFFYSALYIKGEGNTLNYVMQWLKPEDAIRAKELVDGLRLQESEFIEIQEKDPRRIAQTLESIGHT